MMSAAVGVRGYGGRPRSGTGSVGLVWAIPVQALCFIVSALTRRLQILRPPANMGALGDVTISKGLAALASPEVSPPPPRAGTRSLLAQDAQDATGVGSSDDKSGCRMYCVACGRVADSADICRRCAGRMKSVLLSVQPAPNGGRQFYCLQCHKLFLGTHDHHQGMIIPLGCYKGKQVAWSSGDEIWAAIFANTSVQIAKRDRPIRPYLLCKPKPVDVVRCSTCSDIVTTDGLYGSFRSYCTLKCWAAGDRGSDASVEVMLTEAIVAMDKDQNRFCLTCKTAFQHPGDMVHRGHDWLSIRTDSVEHKRWVVIPAGHQMEKTWDLVQKRLGNKVLISDDLSIRCLGCRTRIPVDTGDMSHATCCLECLLDEKTRFVPRCLQLKKRSC
ncbi:hypothetical protein HU200_035647 [Digitaria exilis]|uniref:Uncharacterized protein n=1 Tax=Digitaria exilis TaxID=1010633 RepID=A0A835EN25_9POAL|nr:hypothetical protein HU200_035647 [Digitaria exilis]